MKERIVLIEDSTITARNVINKLSANGFHVHWISKYNDCLEKVQVQLPDLVIVDNIPHQSCEHFCTILRTASLTKNTPVIAYSADDTESFVLNVLNAGADDVVSKQQGLDILLAKIRAVLKRIATFPALEREAVAIGENFRIDPRDCQIAIANQRIFVTPSEFDVIYLLSAYPDRIFSRKEIITLIKGEKYTIAERTVDVFILNLRKKLKSAGQLIMTVRGRGYKLNGEYLSRIG